MTGRKRKERQQIEEGKAFRQAREGKEPCFRRHQEILRDDGNQEEPRSHEALPDGPCGQKRQNYRCCDTQKSAADVAGADIHEPDPAQLYEGETGQAENVDMGERVERSAPVMRRALIAQHAREERQQEAVDCHDDEPGASIEQQARNVDIAQEYVHGRGGRAILWRTAISARVPSASSTSSASSILAPRKSSPVRTAALIPIGSMENGTSSMMCKPAPSRSPSVSAINAPSQMRATSTRRSMRALTRERLSRKITRWGALSSAMAPV